MATTITPSAFEKFINDEISTSSVVGYEGGSERAVRYTFTLPETCTAGATSYSFSKTYSYFGGGSTGLRWNWAVSTNPTEYLNTTKAGDGYGSSARDFSGSSNKNLYPNTTYYLFIYPGETTYGWHYWDYELSRFTLTVDGSITYTISYNANGGTGAPASQTKTYDTAITLSSTKPTREGYTFQGWGVSASDTSVDYAPGASYTTNSEITLYAIWKINTYTISYNANGGTGAPSSQTKTHGVALPLSSTKPSKSSIINATYTVTYNGNGGTVSPSSASTQNVSSYSFKNWNTKQDGTGTSYASGGSYTANTGATLYAQWNVSTSTKALTLPTPTRKGYTFLGWATSSNATSGSTGTYTPTKNITLYAIWKANGLVYISNGSNGYDPYEIWISDGEKYVKVVPYISNGTSWELYG